MPELKRGRVLPGLADMVFGGAMVALAGTVGLRFMRYLPLDLPAGLDEALGSALIAASFLFLYPLLVAPLHLMLVLAIVIVGALAPGRLLAERRRPWRLRPWLHALLWVELLLNHYLFDINPYLAILLLLGLAAVEVDRLRWGERRGSAGYAAAAVIAVAGLALAADTVPDRVAGLVFGLGLWVMLRRGKSWCGSRERRLLTLAGGAAAQLLAAFIPLALPLHGGTKLGDGMAYSFCEAPTHSALFAAVPEAPTMVQWSLGRPHGTNGYVAEYDAVDLSQRARHRFFSETFYGRLEYLLCLDDSVQVGMTNVTIDGRRDQDHAISFSLDDPTRFERDLLGGGAGHGIAYDETNEALFYVSEDNPVLVRIDRETGRRDTVRVRDSERGALVFGPRSIHRRRGTIYLAGWLLDSRAYELDLTTLAVRRTFPHRNGGALGLTVDEEMNRLYTVGLWGMEVFDLESGALIARKRLGMLSRSPAIDPDNDLVFVPSTVEGKIRVFDRRTLAPLGAIAIGYGPRIPYFSVAAGRLFSSSSSTQYYWDAASLKGRFRGRPRR